MKSSVIISRTSSILGSIDLVPFKASSRETCSLHECSFCSWRLPLTARALFLVLDLQSRPSVVAICPYCSGEKQVKYWVMWGQSLDWAQRKLVFFLNKPTNTNLVFGVHLGFGFSPQYTWPSEGCVTKKFRGALLTSSAPCVWQCSWEKWKLQNTHSSQWEKRELAAFSCFIVKCLYLNEKDHLTLPNKVMYQEAGVQVKNRK